MIWSSKDVNLRARHCCQLLNERIAQRGNSEGNDLSVNMVMFTDYVLFSPRTFDCVSNSRYEPESW